MQRHMVVSNNPAASTDPGSKSSRVSSCDESDSSASQFSSNKKAALAERFQVMTPSKETIQDVSAVETYEL